MLSNTIEKDIVHGLVDIFSDNILKIILYGSVARNDNTDESDIDIQEENMEKWGKVLPFYQNVQKEGRVLWQAE